MNKYDNTTDPSWGESLFGPGAQSRQFDFTLLFEQSILAIGPSVLLLLLLPVRLSQLLHQRRKVLQSRWVGIKVV